MQLFTMDFISLIKSGLDVNVTMKTSELKEFALYCVDETKKELEQAVILEKMETYLSPKQVSEILNVNVSTLWRWKQRGYLVPASVGGKRRYKMSAIKRIQNGGK